MNPNFIEHQNYYTQYDIEVDQMMEKIFGKEAVKTFYLLSAFKYRMRLGNKTKNYEEDYKKEQTCLKKYREFNENKINNQSNTNNFNTIPKESKNKYLTLYKPYKPTFGIYGYLLIEYEDNKNYYETIFIKWLIYQDIKATEMIDNIIQYILGKQARIIQQRKIKNIIIRLPNSGKPLYKLDECLNDEIISQYPLHICLLKDQINAIPINEYITKFGNKIFTSVSEIQEHLLI